MTPKQDSGAGRGRPTTEQAAEMENRLLDAAWAVLIETGPDHLSIEKVAAKARAAKKTIYARYANKRMLLGYLLSRRLKLFLADMADSTPTDGQTAQEVFSALARAHLFALVAGQGRLLERVVDWLDATGEDDKFRDAKARSYEKVLGFLEWQIRDSAQRVGMNLRQIADIAPYWLDSVVGHSRTSNDLSEAAIQCWADNYAKLFLKAVSA